ncbi:MAG: SDR family NAD(P)-dependent oxidoreductase [Caldisericia bacterium]|nr:SDR family NAD(P)-dependent oxidoreductase [Caldisericia bacterium]MDD4614706.1 SDR family NAD(P)-dependent oxidoreductase [Caldisericia bacterium]
MRKHLKTTLFMGKTSLITGASSGIGKELAIELAKQGSSIILVSRNENALHQLQNDLTLLYAIPVHVLPIDLSKTKAAIQVYEFCKTHHLQVDILVNNAGFGMATEREFSDPVTLEQMITLQTTTVTVLSSLFSRDMMNNGEGYILNISSICARTPAASTLTYSAVKRYILQYSKLLHCELKKRNITVTCSLPGATNTCFDIHSALPVPCSLRRFYVSPNFVARKSIEGLQKNKTIVLPGFQTKLLNLIGLCIPDRMIYALHKKWWAEKRSFFLKK